MIRRQIGQSDLSNDSYSIWNAFVDLLATEEYGELTEVQKTAQLVFLYDAEVQNGGHLQYFLNSAGQRVSETVEALSRLKLNCQKAILSGAISFVEKQPLSSIDIVDQYVSEASENKFGRFDEQYFECKPSAMDALERYLETYQNEFIEQL